MIKSFSIIIENNQMNDIKKLIDEYAQHLKNNEKVSIRTINSLIIDIYSSNILTSDIFDNVELTDRKIISKKNSKIDKITITSGLSVTYVFLFISMYLAFNYFENSLFCLMFMLCSVSIPIAISLRIKDKLTKKNIYENTYDFYKKIEQKYKNKIKKITMTLVEEIDNDNHYNVEVKNKLKKILIEGNYDFENKKENVLFDELKLKVLTDFTLNDKVIDKTKLISKKAEILENVNDGEMLILNKKLESLKT